MGCSWGWYVSDAWDKLKPSDIGSLIADPACRSAIVGFVSFHRNGYVRHEAVRLLSGIHDGAELPFLLIRQNDWVKPISAEAREAVRCRLKDDNLPAFFHCLPLVVHLLKFVRHDHSELVHQIILKLLRPDRDDLLTEVLRFSNRDVRREVFRIALALDGEHQRRVVFHGLDSNDAVVRYGVRARCGPVSGPKRLTRFFGDFNKTATCRFDGKDCPSKPTFTQRGTKKVWHRALLDLNASIRDLARFNLQNVPGFNGAEFYRLWLTTKEPSLSAISGLGETGVVSDLPQFREFLRSGHPGWRRASVRGLAALGQITVVPELVGMFAA